MKKQPLNLVVVEDELDLCENFVDLFSGPDVKVVFFTDPVEASSAISEMNPDAAFIDYRMPKLSGDKLAEQLPSSIRKYLLTGELDPKPSFGFHEILGKPLDISYIRKIIDELKNEKS